MQYNITNIMVTSRFMRLAYLLELGGTKILKMVWYFIKYHSITITVFGQHKWTPSHISDSSQVTSVQRKQYEWWLNVHVSICMLVFSRYTSLLVWKYLFNINTSAIKIPSHRFYTGILPSSNTYHTYTRATQKLPSSIITVVSLNLSGGTVFFLFGHTVRVHAFTLLLSTL